jgi:glutathione S-transferase
MKLYGSLTSPYTRRCRIALRTSGLDCEFVLRAPAEMIGVSPTARIPYLEAGSVKLSDSTSILKYLRDESGAEFLTNASEFDLFCLSNTVLDSAISLLMSKRLDGRLPEHSQYLTRQAARVESGLDDLEKRDLSAALPLRDAEIRLACLLDWGLFRNLFDLEGRPRLQALLRLARSWEDFSVTAPPADS